MTFLRWIAGTVFAIAAVLFAVANLADVAVVWSPFHAAFVLPLSVFGLGMAVAGFLAGGALVWLNGEPVRRDLRARKKRIRELETALEAANENSAVSRPPISETLVPLLPASDIPSKP